MPAFGELPRAYIYQPARSAMQSAPPPRDWVLEFEPASPREIDPFTGWVGSGDPYASIWRLRFPDRERAIEFAECQGWPYAVADPRPRRLQPKSYADQFKYNLAGPIAQVRQAQALVDGFAAHG